jgi:hypothetical protein
MTEAEPQADGWGDEFRGQRAAANLEYRIRFQTDLNYCRSLSDKELREFRKAHPFNNAAYNEAMRREKRAERWRGLKHFMIFVAVMVVALFLYDHGQLFNVLVVWGAIGALFVLAAWDKGLTIK